MIWVLAAASRAWGGCEGGAQDVRINELLPDPPSTNTGAEWVELVSCAPVAVDLSGWSLAAGTSSYGTPAPIPTGTVLEPGAHLVVGQAVGTDVDLVVAGFTLGNAGTSADAVQLRDAAGQVVDTVVYGPSNSDQWLDDAGAVATSLAPAPGTGESLARVPDGADTDDCGVDFAPAAPSPGRANDGPVADCGGPGSGVVINELVPDPDGSDAGAEWVEIVHGGPEPVDVTGWRLEAGTSSYTVQHTLDGWLAPGDRRVIDGPGLALGNAGSSADALRLVDCAGVPADTVVYGTSNPDGWADDAEAPAVALAAVPGAGQALARRVDGLDTDDNAADFGITDAPTPGAPNPETSPPTCTQAELRINEILPDPSGEDDGAEWIELVSLAADEVGLGGWVIRERPSADEASDVGLPPELRVPPGGIVAIGGELAVGVQWTASVSFGNGTGTDAIELVDCAGEIVDTVVYGEAPNDDQLLDDLGAVGDPYGDPTDGASLARTVDGADTDAAADWRVTNRPTPGASNAAAPLESAPITCSAGTSPGCAVVALQPGLLVAALAAAASRRRRGSVGQGATRAPLRSARRGLRRGPGR